MAKSWQERFEAAVRAEAEAIEKKMMAYQRWAAGSRLLTDDLALRAAQREATEASDFVDALVNEARAAKTSQH